MGGTVFGQFVAIAASPILSRIYTPSDFGLFGIVSAIAMVLGTVMAWRYELAIPLPRSDEDARVLFVLGTGLTAATAIVSSASLLLLMPALEATPIPPQLLPWLHWVPPIAAVLCGYRLLNQWALRQRRYMATARRNVIAAATTVGIQLLVGWRVAGPLGLVAGLGGGQAVGAASLLPGSRVFGLSNVSDIRRLARRYVRFPLLLAPAGLMNASGVYLPLLLVAGHYGLHAAGWLAFTQRILAMPVTIVGQAIAQVYLSELARTTRTGGEQQLRLFTMVSRRLFLVGMAVIVVLLSSAPTLFPLVFGDEWAVSGDMAQALAPALGLQLLASPLSQTLIVYERTGQQLAWDAGRLILVCGSVISAALANLGPVECIWAMSGALALSYALSWALSRRAVLVGTRG